MIYFTKDELRKLSSVCDNRKYEADWILANEEASSIEKACAMRESEYMKHLSEKLLNIANGKARRVEITI